MKTEIYCESDMCVYNNEKKCELSSITVNSIGNCEECIIPTIDDDVLKKYKKELLSRLLEEKRALRKAQKEKKEKILTKNKD